MLYDRQELPEIHYLKHLHDDNKKTYIKYDDVIFNKTLSPHIYENEFMSKWLDKMQPLVSIFFDQMNITKNFKNYIVDKYYYKQR